MKRANGKRIKTLLLATLFGMALMAPHAAFARGNHFQRIDTNNDGRLSLAEMQAAASQRFDKKDANKDGFLTANETRRPERFQKRLSKKDTNGDQKLSKQEMLAAIKAQYLKMDANRDGAVTKEEMQALRKQRKQRRGQRQRNG